MSKQDKKRFCGKECSPLCDFCAYYHFNGIDIVERDGAIYERACYCGEGYCGIDGSKKDPADSCEDKFVCFRVKARKKQKKIGIV